MIKTMEYRALANRVLVVAVTNEHVGDWAAYIDAVDGHDHDKEYEEVARTGNKLPKAIAEYLFPQIAFGYSWRY